ncbi:MAG: hypothetical protein H6622_09240 [Halobacteriovoraceae bacterium]|nr:hypothetical protein [Halobacteriovoraceae bacterium]
MVDSGQQEILKGLADLLTPTMIVVFFIGTSLRALVYWTIKREDWFAREFERRAHAFLELMSKDGHFSFYLATKKLLEKTFYELFILRAIMKRRKPDVIMSISDRIFLIQQGAAFIVKDTLKQIKFLKHQGHPPKMLEITKTVCQNNPCFNKVFGIIPVTINDVLNVLPGMFVIGGIFGTFLGIMEGLFDLTNMDIADVAGTQDLMNDFLSKVSFSMSTSLTGIVLSVTMTIMNTLLNPEKLFYDIIFRFENSLDILWNRSDSNFLPEEIKDFDENRDPIEALAENAVQKEFELAKKFRKERAEHLQGEHLIEKGIQEIIEKEKNTGQNKLVEEENRTEEVIQGNTAIGEHQQKIVDEQDNLDTQNIQKQETQYQRPVENKENTVAANLPSTPQSASNESTAVSQSIPSNEDEKKQAS